MLKISKLADYATIILSYLGAHPETVISASTIAHACHLSVPTVSKILKILTESRLVKSARGVDGGYQLAKSKEEMTVAEIIVAMEGKVALTECCDTETCTLDTKCHLKENWQVVNQAVLKTLSGLTLNDMMRPQTREGGQHDQ